MYRLAFILLFIILNFTILNAQNNLKYNLGDGIIIIDSKQFFIEDTAPITLYKDSACTVPLLNLTLERTTCPTCMGCAEPTHFYKGLIKPFICAMNFSGEGMIFLSRKYDNNKFEIFIDKNGTVAYLNANKYIKYFNWSEYMQYRAKRGDYFVFTRQWDSTIIYNKKYDLKHLPKPNAKLQVGTNIKNIDDVKFYPILVDGYWMQINGMSANKSIGSFWIIWRNETNWLVGFKFDPN